MEKVPKVLVIAASDPSGGAGIQADIRTLTVLKVYPLSVLTAVTVQSTAGVLDIRAVPTRIVAAQLNALFDDTTIDCAKIGALANAPIVRTVAEILEGKKLRRLVLDPVIMPKKGKRLLSHSGVAAMVSRLLPLTYLITPNLDEASLLCGFEVSDPASMRDACKALRDMGATNILLKGGHLSGDPVDILYDGTDFHHFRSKRVKRRAVHGTGCVYSSAIAAYLARGASLHEAVKRAKQFIRRAISQSLSIGKGARVCWF